MNGKGSKLSLLNTGNIVLIDVGLNIVWSSDTASLAPLEMYLKDDGNLVLCELQRITIFWQSFDYPRDTLLPGQPITRYTKLVSSRSGSNHSSSFYSLFSCSLTMKIFLVYIMMALMFLALIGQILGYLVGMLAGLTTIVVELQC